MMGYLPGKVIEAWRMKKLRGKEGEGEDIDREKKLFLKRKESKRYEEVVVFFINYRFWFFH